MVVFNANRLKQIRQSNMELVKRVSQRHINIVTLLKRQERLKATLAVMAQVKYTLSHAEPTIHSCSWSKANYASSDPTHNTTKLLPRCEPTDRYSSSWQPHATLKRESRRWKLRSRRAFLIQSMTLSSATSLKSFLMSPPSGRRSFLVEASLRSKKKRQKVQ